MPYRHLYPLPHELDRTSSARCRRSAVATDEGWLSRGGRDSTTLPQSVASGFAPLDSRESCGNRPETATYPHANRLSSPNPMRGWHENETVSAGVPHDTRIAAPVLRTDLAEAGRVLAAGIGR